MSPEQIAANFRAAELRRRDMRAELLRQETALAGETPPPQAAQPTMADAIAAGDGTLHGAIDYWQARALKAEAAQPVQAQAARQPAGGQWVSVEDRLPPKNTEVLICFDGQNTLVSTGQYTESKHDVNGWCYPSENRGATDEGEDPVVTHWMPAPLLPSEDAPTGPAPAKDAP